MILVTAGTVSYPFPRLIDSCYQFFKKLPKNPVILQTGSYKFKSQVTHITCHQQIIYPKLIHLYKNSEIIISGAGEGSLLNILAYSQTKPIVVPRLTKYNEHVDNQQLTIAKYLAKNNKVIYLKDFNDLSSAITQITKQHSTINLVPNPKLIAYLKTITS